MKDQDVLTIKEFASAAGVSQQAVYQRLNKSLQSYVVEIEGKKHLQKSALLEFSKEKHPRDIEQDSTNIDKDLIKTLQDTIAVLNAQLQVKDTQIAELNERLKDALELSKAHMVLSAQDKQQLPPTPEEVNAATQDTKPDLWQRFKDFWR